MSDYTQGVCHDGAAILKDGEPMTIEQILQELRDSDDWHQAASDLSADLTAIGQQHADMAAFINEAINACFDGGNLDGAWIQERGEELGLLEAVEYDPAVHHIDCEITEPGDTIYVRATWLGTMKEEPAE